MGYSVWYLTQAAGVSTRLEQDVSWIANYSVTFAEIFCMFNLIS